LTSGCRYCCRARADAEADGHPDTHAPWQAKRNAGDRAVARSGRAPDRDFDCGDLLDLFRRHDQYALGALRQDDDPGDVRRDKASRGGNLLPVSGERMAGHAFEFQQVGFDQPRACPPRLRQALHPSCPE